MQSLVISAKLFLAIDNPLLPINQRKTTIEHLPCATVFVVR